MCFYSLRLTILPGGLETVVLTCFDRLSRDGSWISFTAGWFRAGLGGLQLPVIGGQGESGSKLSRKPGSRDHGGAAMISGRLSWRFARVRRAVPKKFISADQSQVQGRQIKVIIEYLLVAREREALGLRKLEKDRRKRTAERCQLIQCRHTRILVNILPCRIIQCMGQCHGMPPGGSMRVVVGGPPPMPPSSRPKGKGSPARIPGSPSRRPPYPPPMPPPGSDGRYPGMPYPHHGHAALPSTASHGRNGHAATSLSWPLSSTSASSRSYANVPPAPANTCREESKRQDQRLVRKEVQVDLQLIRKESCSEEARKSPTKKVEKEGFCCFTTKVCSGSSMQPVEERTTRRRHWLLQSCEGLPCDHRGNG